MVKVEVPTSLKCVAISNGIDYVKDENLNNVMRLKPEPLSWGGLIRIRSLLRLDAKLWNGTWFAPVYVNN